MLLLRSSTKAPAIKMIITARAVPGFADGILTTKKRKLQMSTKQNGEVISRKALDQMRQDVEAIVREMEIRSQIANGVRINEDGIDLDELEGQERELKGLLDELGRGDEWEKIRLEACRRFPVRK